MALALRNNTATAVSNRSFHPLHNIGTAAWVIFGHNKQYFASTQISGSHAIQCSHCSELGGLLGLVCHINKICHCFHITKGSIWVGCDGQEALRAIYDNSSPIGKSHFDYTLSLKYCIKQSPVLWSFCHVKGHQDDHKHYDSLHKWGQLNVDADQLAKDCLHQVIQEYQRLPENISLPEKIGPIFIKVESSPTNIYSKLAHTLQHTIVTQKAREYWQTKQIVLEYCKEMVDWVSLNKATKTLPQYQRRWITKWTSGIIGVGKYTEWWKEQPHSRCPRCMQQEEDVQHVIKCPAPTAVTTWKEGLDII